MGLYNKKFGILPFMVFLLHAITLPTTDAASFTSNWLLISPVIDDSIDMGEFNAAYTNTFFAYYNRDQMQIKNQL